MITPEEKSITAMFSMIALAFVAAAHPIFALTTAPEPTFTLPHRGCYYSSWSIYRPGKARFLPRHFNASLCTIVYYAFAEIQLDKSTTNTITLKVSKPSFGFLTKAGASPYSNATLSVLDSASQLNFLKRKNPNLKLILSVGGWGTIDIITSVVSSSDLRKHFIASAISTIRNLEYDGLDISWEFPTKKDYAYLTGFFTEVRSAFEAEAANTGKTRLILTAAVGNTSHEGYNIPIMNKSLDLFNLMTYDLHTPSFEPSQTGHHCQLFPPSTNSSSANVKDFLEAWEKTGVPKSKMVVGLATHGNSWTLTDSTKAGIAAPANGHGPPGFFTRSKGFLAYFEICENLRSGELVSSLQPDIKTPFARATSGKWWASYEDETSIREKVRWIVGKGYSGVFLWDITLDDFFGGCGVKFPLLNAVKTEYRV